MPNPVINIRFDVDANGGVGALGQLGQGFKFQIAAYGGSQFSTAVQPFSVAASGTVGGAGVAEIVMRRGIFTLSATMTQNAYGRAELVVPQFRSLFGVFRGTMPLFVLRGIGSTVVITEEYRAYAVNIKNAALTEYTNFPFNHLSRFGGETIAFTDTGAFILGADDDDGTAIDAVFELPPDDFQTTKLKRMPYIYLGVKTGKGMKVSAIADETRTVASKTVTKGRTRRAKMARGVKARVWAGRVENTAGADFAVDSVEYLPMILERKV